MDIYSNSFSGQCPDGNLSYTIRQGDAFFKLAGIYNLSTQDIMAANPGVNPNNLQIGQIICIPSNVSPSCPDNASPYTVMRGDTFYNLAQQYGITMQEIMAANPGVNPNNLQIGQVICIPSNVSHGCSDGTVPYTVMQGNTFYNLAQQYGITMQEIMAANPGINPNNLQIGQIICIPSNVSHGCPDGTVTYTVMQGDTFYNLAQQYGMAAITSLLKSRTICAGRKI